MVKKRSRKQVSKIDHYYSLINHRYKKILIMPTWRKSIFREYLLQRKLGESLNPNFVELITQNLLILY